MTLDRIITALLALESAAALGAACVIASVPIGDWAKSWIEARRAVARARE